LRILLTNYHPGWKEVYLFPGRFGGHLDPDSADKALRKAIKRVGLIGVSSHSFRRTALTMMSDNGTPLRIIQEVSGHRNLEQLQAYIEVRGAQEIESRERFEEVYGKDVSLKLFIRRLVRLDRNAAKQAFTTYLEGGNFSANQIHFVENIIDYLTQNGVIDPGLLYEPPFTDSHPEGLDGVFRDDDADQIILLVRSFNETVKAEFGVA
jgi:hypothetical protein